MSAHFIHKNRDVEDSAGIAFIGEVHEQTLAYYQQCRERFGRNLFVIAGFDANVTLPPDIANVTGNATLKPLKTHVPTMQHRILEWLRALFLRASNTYGETMASSELWTCGLKRPATARSQIDFVGLPPELKGIDKH